MPDITSEKFDAPEKSAIEQPGQTNESAEIQADVLHSKENVKIETAPTKTQETNTKPRPNLSFLKKTHHAIPATKDEVTVRIEKIMEDGLKDAFEQLSPVARQEFKIKGEETANKIRELMRGAHLKVKKVFQLIYEWLRLLPGVNRFFLEQEAKIKTDKIIMINKTAEENKIEGI